MLKCTHAQQIALLHARCSNVPAKLIVLGLLASAALGLLWLEVDGGDCAGVAAALPAAVDTMTAEGIKAQRTDAGLLLTRNTARYCAPAE